MGNQSKFKYDIISCMSDNKSSALPTFSLKFSLALISLNLLIPLILAVPFFVAKKMGYSLVSSIGLNLDNFYMFIIISQAISLILSIFFISQKLRQNKLRWQSVGIKPFQIRRSLKYILGYYPIFFGLLLLIVVTIAIATQGGDIPAAADSATEDERFGGFVPALLITVLLAPVIEEVLFRGVLFTSLRQKKGLVFAIVVGGIIFSLAHIGNPIQALGALPLGIYLCFMYHRLGSIIPGILLHASWNLFVLLIR